MRQPSAVSRQLDDTMVKKERREAMRESRGDEKTWQSPDMSKSDRAQNIRNLVRRQNILFPRRNHFQPHS